MRGGPVRLRGDAAASSSLIVILFMIAVVAVGAAGVLVFGLGVQSDFPPQATIVVEEAPDDDGTPGADRIDFRHAGGDTIRLDETEVLIGIEGGGVEVLRFGAGTGRFASSDSLVVGPVDDSAFLNGQPLRRLNITRTGITGDFTADGQATFTDIPSGQVIAEQEFSPGGSAPLLEAPPEPTLELKGAGTGADPLRVTFEGPDSEAVALGETRLNVSVGGVSRGVLTPPVAPTTDTVLDSTTGPLIIGRASDGTAGFNAYLGEGPRDGGTPVYQRAVDAVLDVDPGDEVVIRLVDAETGVVIATVRTTA